MFKNTYKFIQLGLKLKKYKSATSEIEKEKVAEYISHLLEEEGGILLKVGQYLGTDDQYEKPIKSLLERCLNQYIESDSVAVLNDYQNHYKNINAHEYIFLLKEIKKDFSSKFQAAYKNLNSKEKKS